MNKITMLLSVALLCFARVAMAVGGPEAYQPPVCQYGQSVNYDAARTFHIDILVVDDGARAFDAISKYGNDAGQVLYKTVGRYFGPITATVALNIDPRHLRASQLPVLIGNGFCFGMVSVMPDMPGWSKVVISVPARGPGVPTVNGQIALVLPRGPLTDLKDKHGNHISFTPVISLDIPTKYNAPIKDSRFAGWPSTQIARPSGIAGVSWVEKRLLDGEKGSLFYFVHGRN